MPPELAPVIAIAGLILVKEAGLPIPVPSDLVVVGAGVTAGRGELNPGLALVVIILASIVGGVVQYGLLRSVARRAMLRMLGRFGGTERVDRESERLRRGGARSVALARSTPGLRIVAIAASALAGVPATTFVLGLGARQRRVHRRPLRSWLRAGRTHRHAGHRSPRAPRDRVRGACSVGAIGWWLIRRRHGQVVDPVMTAVAWTDACCPACLTLAALDRSSA